MLTTILVFALSVRAQPVMFYEDEGACDEDDGGPLAQVKLPLVGASLSWRKGALTFSWWCLTPAKPPFVGVRGSNCSERNCQERMAQNVTSARRL